MKKLVLVFTMIVMTVVKMAAQEVKATGLHFIQPVKDKEWINHHNDKYSDATYKEFTGQVYFTLTPDRTTDIDVLYDITVNNGKLEMEVTDPNGSILLEHTFSASKRSTETLTLTANKEYKIKFTGKETSGSYKCKWFVKK